MSAVAICTDSSALFPAGTEELLGVIVVPVAVALDGRPYDEREGSLDDFYARLARGAKATTSQPSPGELLDTYARAADAGAEEVLSIHLDARVSGTVNSAELAAREAPIRVTVVDSGTASFGVGLCVRAAADALAGGMSPDGAADRARSLGETLRNVFVAHAGPGGRVPETQGWSLLELANGIVEAQGAYSDMEEAIRAMAARVFAEDGPLAAAVGHAAASTLPAADALALALEGQAHVTSVERYRVGAAVGAHTGGMSFGAFWWPSG